MDINHSVFSRLKTNKIHMARKQSPSAAKEKSSLSLKEGQIIKGEIVDHRFQEVRIRISPDEQVIIAKTTGDIPVIIGQEANFQVVENSGSQLTLKLIPSETSSASEAIIQKAVTEAGLPLSDRNRMLVEELLNNRMPIDKLTIQTLAKQLQIHRDTTPASIVLMYKHHIPISSANIRQFVSYQNGTNQLLVDLENLIKHITDMLEANENVKLRNETQEKSESTQSNTGIANNVEITQSMNQSKMPDPLLINAKLLELLISDGNTALSHINEETNRYIKPSDTNDIYHLSEVLSDESSDELSKELSNPVNLLKKMQIPLNTIMSSDDRIALSNFIQQLPDSVQIGSQILEGSALLDTVLNFMKEKITSLDNETALHFIMSPEYTGSLRKAFLRRWSITPEELKQKSSVSDLFRNIEEDMSKIKALTKALEENSEKSRIQNPIQAVKENLSFLKDFNELYTYLALPMQFKNQEVHADIYIYTNKKALQEKKNLSVLLHLDMENLGPLNIHLIMEHNTIRSQFYLENKTSAQLMKEYLPTLATALQKRGFSFHAEIKDSYQKPDFTKDFIELNASDTSVQRYTFDIRM